MLNDLFVLNVDHDEAGLYAKSRVLRQAGFQVAEARTGSETLHAVMTLKPALVLLGPRVPDISGAEICRQIKADPSTASTLVLQISATSLDVEHGIEVLESRVDAYLAESLESRRLIVQINSLLRLARAEQQLHRTEEFLNRLIDSSDDCITLLDLEGRLLFISQGGRRLLEMTDAHPLPSQSWTELWQMDDSEVARQALAAAVLNGGASFQAHCHTMTGKPRWCEVTCTRLSDPQGKPERILAVLRDITERRLTEERRQSALQEAQRENRAKDQFLAFLSHELRAPLQAILGWSQLMEKGKADPSRALRIIQRNGRLQLQLVKDLLDASRIIFGSMQLQLREGNLRDIVLEVVQSLSPQADDNGITVECDIESADFSFRCDPDRLNQVVWNLLANSIKFTAKGGRVKIILRRSGDSGFEIEVNDTGHGIAPEFLPKVFETFRQEDTDSRNQGLGLGLSLVKHLVEMHGGTVEALSPGLGKGATFRVTLPAARSTSSAAQ